MALTSKSQLLYNMIKAPLGHPIIPIEITDQEVMATFIVPALIEYYKYRPFEYGLTVDPSETGSVVDVPKMSDKYPNDVSLGEDFFVGVVHVSRAPAADSITSMSTLNNLYLGGAGVFGDRMNENMELTVMEMGNAGNMIDFFENDITFTYDQIKQTIYVPPGDRVSLLLGYGFTKIDFVPYQHLRIVALLASRELLISLKTSRGTITIQGDVDLNEEVLSEMIQTLNDRIPIELDQIATPVLMFA